MRGDLSVIVPIETGTKSVAVVPSPGLEMISSVPPSVFMFSNTEKTKVRLGQHLGGHIIEANAFVSRSDLYVLGPLVEHDPSTTELGMTGPVKWTMADSE